MEKIQTGLNRTLYIFNLSEKDKYKKYCEKYDGFYTNVFIENKLAIEVKRRILK